MKKTAAFAAALAAAVSLAVLAGCREKSAGTDAEAPPAPESHAAAPAVTTAYPKGSIKVGDKAVCVVCAVNGTGHGQEEARAVLDYKEKTYAFCSEAEKAEFISDPAKYAQGP